MATLESFPQLGPSDQKMHFLFQFVKSGLRRGATGDPDHGGIGSNQMPTVPVSFLESSPDPVADNGRAATFRNDEGRSMFRRIEKIIADQMVPRLTLSGFPDLSESIPPPQDPAAGQLSIQ